MMSIQSLRTRAAAIFGGLVTFLTNTPAQTTPPTWKQTFRDVAVVVMISCAILISCAVMYGIYRTRVDDYELFNDELIELQFVLAYERSVNGSAIFVPELSDNALYWLVYKNYSIYTTGPTGYVIAWDSTSQAYFAPIRNHMIRTLRSSLPYARFSEDDNCSTAIYCGKNITIPPPPS